MGAIGGLIGTAGGVSGTGISGPGQAGVQNATTVDQAKDAYTGAQSGLASQQALLEALQGQNGVRKQVASYDQGQNIMNQLNHSGIVANQNAAIAAQKGLAAQQQGLAQQYQNVANGVGPNPAQAMLNQATGQNVANQAALMAGQRGAGANVGLMARQAAGAGANIQQQAVGQAATMQANQQLNALSGLGQAQQAIGGTNQSVAGIANSQLAAQQAQQQALAAQSANMTNQRAAATTGLSQGQQAEQAQVLGALQGQNNNAVGMQSNVNSANASMANTSMQGQQGLVGGLFNGVGGLLGAEGGYVKMAEGGIPAAPAPSSSFGQFLSGWTPGNQVGSANSSFVDLGVGQNKGADSIQKGLGSVGSGVNDYMNKPLQPGKGAAVAGPDISQMPSNTMTAAQGGLAEKGGHVAAKNTSQKAVKSGNSYANDKVPALLSEGEIVIPREVLQSSDPIKGAADFVANIISKRGKKPLKMKDGGKVEDSDSEIPDKPEDVQLEQPQEEPMDVPVAGQPAQQGQAPVNQQLPDTASAQSPAAPAKSMLANAPMPEDVPKGLGMAPEEKAQDHLNYADDLAKDRITPQTYSDLFDKKSTLGKVGTIFGLLVGGAGAGLSHQPNMLLDMMNKEIERDLESQKQNIENKRNFLSLQYNHDLQKAQVAEHQMNVLGKQVDLAPKAATAGKVLDYFQKSGGNPFLGNYFKAVQQISSPYIGAAKAYETVGHDLNLKTQNNPQANAVYHNVVKPALDKKVAELHAKANLAVKEGTQDFVRKPAVDPNLSMIVHNSNLPSNDVGLIDNETQRAEQVRNLAYDYYNAFNKLKDLPAAGQAPGMSAAAGLLSSITHLGQAGNAGAEDVKEAFERSRSEIMSPLVAELKRGLMGADEAESLAKAILPHFADNPKTMKEAFDQGMQRFKNLYRSPALERYNGMFPGLFRSFPNLPYTATTANAESKESKKEDGKKESQKSNSFNDRHPVANKILDFLGGKYIPPK